MERKVAQLNNDGFFLYETSARGRGMPSHTREDFPPDKALLEHQRWRWNGKKYEATFDYRGQTVYRPDGSTYYPTTWGPLPEGDSLTPPPPSEEQIATEARAYVLGELAALDAEYLTPRTMAGLAVGDEYALEAYRIHEEKAEPWRERLAAIPAVAGGDA